jgi:hypothetical protein
MTGFIPKLMDWMPHNEDGIQGGHLYIPWWIDNKKLDFPRGYHVELSGGRRMPSAGFGGTSSASADSTPDEKWAATASSSSRTTASSTAPPSALPGRGEMIPNADSYCELDPNTWIASAFRCLRFSFKWSDHEINQAKHMQDTFRASSRRWAARSRHPCQPCGELRLWPPAAHDSRNRHDAHGKQSVDVRAEQEQPGARREEPVRGRRRAVCQSGRQEPTWTILALSMRASEYIVEERRKGGL